ncbi:MAG TPA: hypothetical protein VGF49_04000 [Candidatus Solibacter sp.]|jgi:hypothetical protein
MSMPNLFQGPIAVEYGEIALTIHADDDKPGNTTGDSCGSDCTSPFACQRGELPKDSCPVIPGREKKYQAFAPALPGWSEPPAV